jgi:hypothetical protein
MGSRIQFFSLSNFIPCWQKVKMANSQTQRSTSIRITSISMRYLRNNSAEEKNTSKPTVEVVA